MDDLISRQAAITAVLELDVSNRVSWKDAVIDTLDTLQSAQPEIIRCKDCKHGRPYKHTTAYVECKVDGDPIDRDSDFFCRYGERRE